MATSLHRPRRTPIIIIAVTSFIFHLQLFRWLSVLGRTLASAIADDGLDGEGSARWQGVVTIINLAKLISLLSTGVAGLGIAGAVKDKPSFLRVFTLNSFLSLLLELVLLLFVTFLALSSHTSRPLATSVCEALANADLPFDVFGYDLQSCEERFGSMLGSAAVVVGVVAIIRAVASVHLLTYFRFLERTSRKSNKPNLSIDTRRHPYHADSSPPSKRRSAGDHAQRIFLLPSPRHETSEDNVPLLSLTAPSPLQTSFPPAPSTSSAPPLPAISETPERKYFVYAPVMMTAEEARKIGAKEVVLGSHHSSSRSTRARSNSHRTPTKESSNASSSTVTASSSVHDGERIDAEDELVTPVATASPLDSLLGSTDKGKGKQA